VAGLLVALLLAAAMVEELVMLLQRPAADVVVQLVRRCRLVLLPLLRPWRRLPAASQQQVHHCGGPLHCCHLLPQPLFAAPLLLLRLPAWLLLQGCLSGPAAPAAPSAAPPAPSLGLPQPLPLLRRRCWWWWGS
jgi:hypothetical protein